MKFILYLIVALTAITGCTLNSTYKLTSGDLLILKNNPVVATASQNNTKQDSLIRLGLSAGDTLSYSARLETLTLGVGPEYFYKIKHKSNYYFIDEKNGICLDRHNKKELSLWAIFPREKESEIWTLAINFVMNNSDLKIQTQTDVIVQTFNPFREGQRGWRLNKVIKGDLVEIIAHCSVYSDFSGSGNLQVERLYYFLNTGRVEQPNFFIY